MGGGPLADKCWQGGEGGGKNSQKFADIRCEQSLMQMKTPCTSLTEA